MSKKVYVQFAGLINEMREAQNAVDKNNLQSKEYVKGSRACLDTITRETCDIFSSDNPNFDRERFLKACGLS